MQQTLFDQDPLDTHLAEEKKAPTPKELAEQGMKRALDHAESVYEGWKIKVFELFKTWISRFEKGHRFLMEDFNEWSLENGLDTPPNGNAFGHLPGKAARENLIRDTGDVTKGKKKRSHAGRVTIWEKL